MFGFSLVPTEELRKLRETATQMQRLHFVVRRMSQWGDLAILWKYVFNGEGFIDAVNTEYSLARRSDGVEATDTVTLHQQSPGQGIRVPRSDAVKILKSRKKKRKKS